MAEGRDPQMHRMDTQRDWWLRPAITNQTWTRVSRIALQLAGLLPSLDGGFVLNEPTPKPYTEIQYLANHRKGVQTVRISIEMSVEDYAECCQAAMRMNELIKSAGEPKDTGGLQEQQDGSASSE